MGTNTSNRALAWCFGLRLFPDLALCQPRWHPAIPPKRSTVSPLSSYDIWQNAKYSWQPANSAPPDPHRSQSTTYLTSVTKIGPEKAQFCGQLTLTFDLGSQKISLSPSSPISMQKIKFKVHWLCPFRCVNDGWTDGRIRRKYIWIISFGCIF